MATARCLEGPVRRLGPRMLLLVGWCVCGLGPFGMVRHAGADPPAAERDAVTPVGSEGRHTPVTAAQIEQWIEQLADDAYTVRQLAADRLLDAGAVAHEPLLAVAEGPDPEVRAAARRLVALIEESEFQRRLSAFAADTDGRRGLTLPGWKEFKELLGGDAGARGLFVDMQQSEAPLLAEVFSDQPRLEGDHWEERLARLLRQRAIPGRSVVTPPLGSCATMLFLGSLPHADVSEQTAMQLVTLIQQAPLRDALQADRGDPVRRLVVGWITHCPNQNENALRQRFALSMKYDLAEVVPLALAVAHGDPQYLAVDRTVRAGAILAVGKFGGPEEAADLEPLLEDDTVCLSGGQSPNLGQRRFNDVQVRDVALAVILHLNKRDLKEYGFTRARRQRVNLFDLKTLGMESDEHRAAAIAKWQKWKNAQPAAKKASRPNEE